MSKHTPEPWKYTEASGCVESAGNVVMIICGSPFNPAHDCPSREEWPDNAERIVACVNACAGIANPAEAIQAMRKILPILEALQYTVGLGSNQMQRIKAAKAAWSQS